MKKKKQKDRKELNTRQNEVGKGEKVQIEIQETQTAT